MHLNKLIGHISYINFAVYICQRKNLLEAKASKIKEKLNLHLWRKILHGSRTPETNPVFFLLSSIHIFPLISSNFLCQIWDIWSISYLIFLLCLWPVMPHLISWKWCFFTQICGVFCPFSIHHGSCSGSFSHFSPPQRVSVTSQKLLSSASKAACLSSIELHALYRNHESHSHFHVQELVTQRTWLQRSRGWGGKQHSHHSSGGELEKPLSFSKYFH